MIIENVDISLRNFGEDLFRLVNELGGTGPKFKNGWYIFTISEMPPIYFRFIGKRGRVYSKNSIHLCTKWDDRFSSIDGIVKGNNWHVNNSSADLCIRPNIEKEIECAQKFILYSFKLNSVVMHRSTHSYSKESIPPLNSCYELKQLEKEYWDLISRNEASEEKLFEQEFADARLKGFLSKELFVRVGRWKSVRNTQNYMSNSTESIHIATKIAFTATDDKVALEALMGLRGVALRTASAILHWMRPDHYPILDFRVVNALGLTEPSSYENYEFYSQIATIVRNIAQEHDLNLRTIDRALWAWDKKQN